MEDKERKLLEPFKRKTQQDGALSLGPNWKSVEVYVIPFGDEFIVKKANND